MWKQWNYGIKSILNIQIKTTNLWRIERNNKIQEASVLMCYEAQFFFIITYLFFSFAALPSFSISIFSVCHSNICKPFTLFLTSHVNTIVKYSENYESYEAQFTRKYIIILKIIERGRGLWNGIVNQEKK